MFWKGQARRREQHGLLLSGLLVRKTVILVPSLAGIFPGSVKSCLIKSYQQPSEVCIIIVMLQMWKPRLKDAPEGALAAGESKRQSRLTAPLLPLPPPTIHAEQDAEDRAPLCQPGGCRSRFNQIQLVSIFLTQCKHLPGTAFLSSPTPA